VNAMLGTVDRNHVLTLLVALAEQEPGGVLQALATVSEHCPGELALLDELISQLHQLAVCQAVPGSHDETITQLAAALSAEQVQLYYDVAVRGRRDLQDAPDSRAALEMLLLRMVLFTPKGVLPSRGEHAGAKKPEAAAPSADAGGKPDLRALLDRPAAAPTPPAAQPAASPVAESVSQGGSTSAALAQVESPAPQEPAQETAPEPVQAEPEPPQPEPEPAAKESGAPEKAEEPPLAPLSEPTSESEVATWWAALLLRLDLDGTVRNIARNAVLVSREETVWTLRISTGHEVLVNRERLEELSGALENYFQRRIQIQVEYERKAGDTPEAMAEARRQELLVDATRTLHEDPVVQQLVSTFDGRLDENSVTPKETVE